MSENRHSKEQQKIVAIMNEPLYDIAYSGPIELILDNGNILTLDDGTILTL